MSNKTNDLAFRNAQRFHLKYSEGLAYSELPILVTPNKAKTEGH